MQAYLCDEKLKGMLLSLILMNCVFHFISGSLQNLWGHFDQDWGWRTGLMVSIVISKWDININYIWIKIRGTYAQKSVQLVRGFLQIHTLENILRMALPLLWGCSWDSTWSIWLKIFSKYAYDMNKDLIVCNIFSSQTNPISTYGIFIRCGGVMADNIAYAKFTKSLLIW